MSLFKRPLFWIYAIFLFSSVIIFTVINVWVTTPFLLLWLFLVLIFLPGFSLSRILKINYTQDRLGQIILYLTLGFIFNLFICLGAIAFGLNITVLLIFYVIILSSLFIVSFVYDLPEFTKNKISFDKKEILNLGNLLYLFLFLFIILVLATINQLGTNFTGDPLYHLAIMRKVVSNESLSIANLSFVKNQLHLAYAIPIWHVFLSLVSKIAKLDIVSFYREIPMVLSLLVFLVWYWFFLKIIPNVKFAVLALFLFILYHFGPNAYFFTRLAVPDTINQLLLLPLALALALKYVLGQSSSIKHLIILSLLLPLMGLIHWTQYFYYLTAIGFFGFLYLLFWIPKFDWSTIKKILQVIFANMVLVLPLLLFLQFKISVISENIGDFAQVAKTSRNDRFYKFTPILQLAYVLLPLLVLFSKKYRAILLLLSIFLVGPLVFNIPGLQEFLRNYLSHVFVNRFYTNLGEWPFVIWAIILGFVLILIDRLLNKTFLIGHFFRYALNFVLVLLTLWLFFIQLKFEKLEIIHQNIFSNTTQLWLVHNYNWLVIIISLAVLVIYIGQHYFSKLDQFFEFQKIQNELAITSLILIIVLFFSIPAQSHLKNYGLEEFKSGRFFKSIPDSTLLVVDPAKFGGLETLDFINQNIPAKSVFDTNTRANYTLPIMVDVHMASYTFDPDPTKKYENLYKNIPLEEKLSLLKEGDIDYILYQFQSGETQSLFNQSSKYFIPIYNNSSVVIFKINKNKVQLDAQL